MAASRAVRTGELGLLAFLLTTPFGAGFPAAIRDACLLVLCVSVLAAVMLRRHLGSDRGEGSSDASDSLGTPGTGGGDDRPSFLRPGFLGPVVAFHAVLGVSIACSYDPALSVRASIFAPVALVVFLAVQLVVHSGAAARRLGAALLIVMSLLAADAVVQFVTGWSILGEQGLYHARVRGSVPHPNDLGIIAILLPLAIVTLGRGGRLTQATIVLVVALSVVALVMSRSRNAWIGLGVGAFVLGVLHERRRAMLLVLLLGGLAFAAAVALDVAGSRERVLSVATPMAEGRIGLWISAWDMFRDAPLLGQGPGMFGELYLEYLRRADLPHGYEPEIGLVPWAHDIYLELLCERGGPGLLSLAWLTVVAGVCIRAGLVEGEQWRRDLSIGVAASLATFLVMGIFDLTFLKDWVALVFWLLLGLSAAAAPPMPRAPRTVERPRGLRRGSSS